jgi:hypothetical protein
MSILSGCLILVGLLALVGGVIVNVTTESGISEAIAVPTQVEYITATPPPAVAPHYQATIDAQQLTIAALEAHPSMIVIVTATPDLIAPPAEPAVATIDPALLPAMPASPTPALLPTAVTAEVEIASVQFWGDITAEVVEIRNLGNVVNLRGWELVNERGESFVFPNFRMQQGSLVRIFSRQGQNTPAALYWNRETPAWTEGDTATLIDANGQVQAVFRVGQTP